MSGKLKPKLSSQIEESLVEKYCNPKVKVKPEVVPRSEVLKSLAREQRSIDRVKKLKAEEKRMLEKLAKLSELAEQQIDNFKDIVSIADYSLESFFRENNSDLNLASLIYVQALAKHFAKVSEAALNVR